MNNLSKFIVIPIFLLLSLCYSCDDEDKYNSGEETVVQYELVLYNQKENKNKIIYPDGVYSAYEGPSIFPESPDHVGYDLAHNYQAEENQNIPIIIKGLPIILKNKNILDHCNQTYYFPKDSQYIQLTEEYKYTLEVELHIDTILLSQEPYTKTHIFGKGKVISDKGYFLFLHQDTTTITSFHLPFTEWENSMMFE
jgi:hypothetical protein